MSLLSSLKAEEGVKIADEKDVLGGGNGPMESGAYRAKIGMAYTEKSKGGALGLFLTLLVGDSAREVRQILWMTSGNEKGNKTYYTKDGENYPLPGYSMANSLALLTTGKEISELDTEEKVIKLYNSEVKAEVATKVQAVTELIGQEVVVGLIKQTVDKTKETSPGSKIYEPTGETREENEIDKFFCAKEGHENKTTTEIKAKAEKAEFYDAWTAKWTGVTKNKAKGASAGGTAGVPGKPGAAAAATGTAKPKQSLFGG
jgi:hypothetical protein